MQEFFRLADVLEKYPVSDAAARKEVLQNLSAIKRNVVMSFLRQFVVLNLIEEKKFDAAPLPFPPPEVPGEFWRHVYKKTPFMYFSKKSIYDAVRKICEAVKISGELNTSLLNEYENSSFIITQDAVSSSKEMFNLVKKCNERIDKLSKKYGVLFK
jgi:hypothetical protein